VQSYAEKYYLAQKFLLLYCCQANAWRDLSKPMFQVSQNGYIYVYSCNTSAMTVRTDNLFIAHYQGSLLEEFHYYPFGICF
jgi:hypothetical protein